MAKPEIKAVSDLRGKKIGITRIGSSTHTSALYALNQAGLKPSDYQILPLVESTKHFYRARCRSNRCGSGLAAH